MNENAPLSRLTTVIASLPDNAMISKKELAQCFARHTTSVDRAVRRGELPPPCRLFGQAVWTVKTIREHIEAKLNEARAEQTETKKRLAKHGIH